MSQPLYWIVIPCYNEALRLPGAEIHRWLSEHPAFGFILVNDGSTDATSQVIADLARAVGQQCVPYDLPINKGKAEAVRQGLLQALKSSPKVVGYFDADLATPLDELPPMVAILNETPDCDMVFGARVRLLGRDIRRRAKRHYLGRFFAAAASIVLGLAIYDTQCGAKVIRVADWTRAILEQPFCSRWIFDVELLARYLKDVKHAVRWPAEPCGIIEMPVHRWTDVGGSKIRPKDYIRAACDLLIIARNYPRTNRTLP